MTSLIKKTLLTTLFALGGFLLIIFSFGNAAPLTTEIAPKTSLVRFESVLNLKAYERVVPENATKELAGEIAKELIAQNPNGPELSENGRNIASIDPEELVQRAIENTFSDLQVDDLRPNVDLDDLTVVQSTEPKFIESYFNAVNAIFAQNFPPTLTINTAEPAKTDFAAFTAAFDKTSTALYHVTVPYMFASMHQKLIGLIGAQRNTFALIKNYELDPAQASIAIEAGNRFTVELVDIFNAMNSYAVNHNLTIAQS